MNIATELIPPQIRSFLAADTQDIDVPSRCVLLPKAAAGAATEAKTTDNNEQTTVARQCAQHRLSQKGLRWGVPKQALGMLNRASGKLRHTHAGPVRSRQTTCYTSSCTQLCSMLSCHDRFSAQLRLPPHAVCLPALLLPIWIGSGRRSCSARSQHSRGHWHAWRCT
jgi:hypothetical protein